MWTLTSLRSVHNAASPPRGMETYLMKVTNGASSKRSAESQIAFGHRAKSRERGRGPFAERFCTVTRRKSAMLIKPAVSASLIFRVFMVYNFKG